MRTPIPLIDNLEHLDSPLSATREILSRHPGIQSLNGVFDDLIHSIGFLMAYNGSTATFNSYRREVERLLQWCYFVRKIGLTELTRQDAEDFIRFCQSPPTGWVGDRSVARFKGRNERIPNPAWRPFLADSGQGFLLSQKSLQALFAVLSSYFGFLVQEDYLRINPISAIRQKSKFLQKHAYKAPVRRISNLQWDYVVDTVGQLAELQPQVYERSLFVIRCLLGMYLRISELVADERSIPVMGDFRQDADGYWWLTVVGKGNKARMVTVSDEMLEALQRYRVSRGLSPLPAPGEKSPLIPRLKGQGPVTSTRQIRYMVQDCFERAFEKMRSEGLEQEAQELKVATVHWLRHTGISEDVRFRPKEHVKEDAGHASMATTDRYINTEMRERHASARFKKLKPEY